MSRDIFCDIKKNREDFAILRENDYATIIVDQNQNYKKHLLIIPDKHSVNISQVDEKTWKEGLAPLIAYGICQLRKNPEIVGFHLNTNAGHDAHQSVFHTHIHLVSKYRDGSGFKTNFRESEKDGYRKFEGAGEWKTEASILKTCHELFAPLQDHLKKCEGKGVLTRGTEGSLENFHIFARVDEVDGKNHDKTCFHFIPNPKVGKKEFCWMEGFGSRYASIEEMRAIRDEISGITGKKPDKSPQEDPITPPIPDQNGKHPPTKEDNQPTPNKNPEIPNNQPSSPDRDKKKKELEERINHYKQTLTSTESQERKKELEEEFLSSLEKIIGDTEDLIDLNDLESSYQKHDLYTQDIEIRRKIDDFFHAQRAKLDSSLHQPKNNSGHDLGRIILVILLVSGGGFLLLFTKQKKKKHKKN